MLKKMLGFKWNLVTFSILESQDYYCVFFPEVTSELSSCEYSIFLTQFEWPRRVRIRDFKFRTSHSATVVSSEQLAKVRVSRNLQSKICIC